MKTDRELLELAAKAAGLKIHIWGTKGSENCAIVDADVNQRWNPLTDDGDALRLAVKMGMRVYIYNGGGDDTTCVAGDELSRQCISTIEEKHGDDKYAATRRAITRAAAAIGEGMK